MWLPVTLQAEHSFERGAVGLRFGQRGVDVFHRKADVVQPLVAALGDPRGKAPVGIHGLGHLELDATQVEDGGAVAALAELLDLHLVGHAQQTLVGGKRSIDIAHRKGHMFDLGYLHVGSP